MEATSLSAIRRAIRSADAPELRAPATAALGDPSATEALARFVALRVPP